MVDITVETTGEDGGYHGGATERRLVEKRFTGEEQYGRGIKREFSIDRTPQHNGIAERRNRTLIEAARTTLVDSKLPTTFWVEAVNTACYVLNRVLVIKPHTKTPYEIIHGRTPLIDFMKPFRCPVTILNTRDHLGKFDGKADEGFFVGYSVVSKAMRVFNKRTMIVKETLNIRFLENAPNVTGNGPDWLFDVDSLTIYMNYVPVKSEPEQEYILIPFCTTDLLISQGPKDSEEDVGMKPTEVDESGSSNKGEEDEQGTISEFKSVAGSSFTNDDPSSPVNAAKASNAFEDHLFEQFSPFKNAFALPHVPNVFLIDDTGIFGNAYDDEDVGAEADLNNLEITMNMDVKSAFLYGTIEEEVYVCQPPGFEDPHFPNKVYKVEKALYGLHQAPRAWYETLSTYLLENGFRRGTIDKTLFIKKDKSDILLVKWYAFNYTYL
ncbi:retrovirus-related pol polyprotein from transposon TNT 1-94 [Tanacetum coccineum]